MPRLTQSVADTVDYFAALNAGLPACSPPMKDLRILDLLEEVAEFKARAERAEAERAILRDIHTHHVFASKFAKPGGWSSVLHGASETPCDTYAAVIASVALARAAAQPPAVLGGAHDICTIGTHASGEGH